MTEEDATLAKSVVNDTFMTDLPLTCAPHVIGLAAILLALVLRPNAAITGQGTSGSAAAAGLAAAQAALSQAQGRGVQQSAGPETPGALEAAAKKKPQDMRVWRVQQFAGWLADSNVDIPAMVDATQEIISFYECYEQYNEKLTREQINRYVKARGLDK